MPLSNNELINHTLHKLEEKLEKDYSKNITETILFALAPPAPAERSKLEKFALS